MEVVFRNHRLGMWESRETGRRSGLAAVVIALAAMASGAALSLRGAASANAAMS